MVFSELDGQPLFGLDDLCPLYPGIRFLQRPLPPISIHSSSPPLFTRQPAPGRLMATAPPVSLGPNQPSLLTISVQILFAYYLPIRRINRILLTYYLLIKCLLRLGYQGIICILFAYFLFIDGFGVNGLCQWG